MKARVMVNAVLFYAGWFAAILGAANARPWLGVLFTCLWVPGHLAVDVDRRKTLTIVLVAAVIGYVFDSLLVIADVMRFPEQARLGGPSTLWMVALWINLALTFDYTLAWLRGRYVVAAVFGGIGGATSYLAGAKLHAVTLHENLVFALLTVGILWALAMPLLMYLDWRVRHLVARGQARQQPGV